MPLSGLGGYHPRHLAYYPPFKPTYAPLYKSDDKSDDKSMSLLQSMSSTWTCMERGRKGYGSP
jgi:hypothetical protein